MINLTASEETLVRSGVTLPRVNLMPPEFAEARRLRRAQAGLGAAVVASAAAVVVLAVLASSGVSDAQTQLDQSQAQGQVLSTRIGGYHDVAATYKRAADAQAMLVAAMGQEVRYSRLVADLGTSLPEDVWLKSVTFAQTAPGTSTTPTPTAASSSASTTTAGSLGSITISGVAFQHDEVSAYLEQLTQVSGLGTPALQSSTETLLGAKKVVDFSLTVPLVPAALSGRYTKTGS